MIEIDFDQRDLYEGAINTTNSAYVKEYHLKQADLNKRVTKIDTQQEFDNTLRENDKLIIVLFYTQWSPECQMISGRYEVLADEIRDKAIIVKVDCDENNETCQA